MKKYDHVSARALALGFFGGVYLFFALYHIVHISVTQKEDMNSIVCSFCVTLKVILEKEVKNGR